MTEAANPGETRLWLVRGDDARLVADKEAAIVDSLRKGGGLDVVTFDGDGALATEICTALEQMHMFADAALVAVRQAEKLASEEAGALAEFVSRRRSEGGELNYLVLSSFTGAVSQKLVKLAQEAGSLEDLRLGGKEREAFLSGELSGSHLSFAPDAVARLKDFLGEDVARVRGIVEVLEAAFPERHRVSAEELAPYLSRSGAQPLYLITNAIENASGARPEVEPLRLLKRFLEDMRVHPLVVCAVLSRRMAEIASVHVPGERGGVAANARLEELGGKKKAPFAADKLAQAASGLDMASLAKALNWCAEAEGRLKGLDGVPEEFAVELLVARLANLFARKRGAARVSAGRSR